MKIETMLWGHFKQFAENEKCAVKIITINSNEEISLQMHKKRKEFWYFIDDAVVQIGDMKLIVKEGDCKIINNETKHRIYAKDKKIRLMEVSFGEFDEEDEIRLEDKYNRYT